MIDFDSVQENVLEKLRELYEIEVLKTDTINVPAYYNLTCYWLVMIPVDFSIFGSNQLELIVGLPSEFPLVLPKIFLSKKYTGKILFLPHIDQHRFICTYDEERSVPNPMEPVNQVLLCLLRAKKIVEAGLKGENIADYKDEYIAYWEQTYRGEKEVNLSMLSAISEELNVGDTVDLLVLNKMIGKYDSIVLGKCQNSNLFRIFFKEWAFEFKKYRAFYVGSLDLGFPPYLLRNRHFNKLIRLKNKNLQDQFFSFLKIEQKEKVVLFDTEIEGYRNIQGLRIGELARSAHGFRKRELSTKLAFQHVSSNKLIQRISIMPIHSNRLLKRTTGIVDNSGKVNRFAIAGLGSIGSNLMYYLSSFSNPVFHLTDPDEIQTENIARHFLGLNYTGQTKVSALKQFFEHSDPNIEIDYSIDSIIEIIEKNSNKINNYDLLFVCVGKWNIEKWIADALAQTKLVIPVCFIWVEPYLLGGHALYIHPDANRFQNFFDENNRFHSNVISSNEYENSNQLLSLREAGCQSTYRPYSKEKVVMFLSKMFPQLKIWITEKPVKSESFTWIGYEEDLLKNKIKFANWVENYEGDISIITK